MRLANQNSLFIESTNQGRDDICIIVRESGADVESPKHGKIDPENTPHVGGNTWAGGTGGRDTAGLGGENY